MTANSARTDDSWCAPTDRTGSSPTSRSRTPLASPRSSNIWSGFRADGSRPFPSPGTAGPVNRVGSAGSISIRTSALTTRTSCTGPSARRTASQPGAVAGAAEGSSGGPVFPQAGGGTRLRKSALRLWICRHPMQCRPHARGADGSRSGAEAGTGRPFAQCIAIPVGGRGSEAMNPRCRNAITGGEHHTPENSDGKRRTAPTSGGGFGVANHEL